MDQPGLRPEARGDETRPGEVAAGGQRAARPRQRDPADRDPRRRAVLGGQAHRPRREDSLLVTPGKKGPHLAQVHSTPRRRAASGGGWRKLRPLLMIPDVSSVTARY